MHGRRFFIEQPVVHHAEHGWVSDWRWIPKRNRQPALEKR
nr:MAG TPA: hypothetical protein [Caudoviricetes sp.]